MTPTAPALAHVAGSDRPEKPELRIGFIPLTDCAPVVMAAELGFDRRYGVRIVPTREASWAAVRDKLAGGELDMAQALYGLVYGMHLGVGMPGDRGREMAVLMTLSRNGQAITLSRALAERGAVDGEGLARAMAAQPRAYAFAQTFPTGTHAMWLYYWLAAHGIHPLRDAKVITVPPPLMVASLRSGAMDGFCAGEPWNQRAIVEDAGITAATSQSIWPDHPEKVLGATADFVDRHPNSARAAVMAVLEACRWLDEKPAHRLQAAEVLAGKAYIPADAATIAPRMLGRYDNGLGRRWDDAHPLAFFDGGAVNFPYLSDGMWFPAQHKRWGLLREHPDYLAVARRVQRTALYAEAAGALGVALPAAPMRASTLVDGVRWDGSDPAAYADSFSLHG